MIQYKELYFYFWGQNIMNDKIIIKGAKEHNLKNINIEIPKNKLVVMTGVSTSGLLELSKNCLAYADRLSPYLLCPSAYIVSNARDDLPEP